MSQDQQMELSPEQTDVTSKTGKRETVEGSSANGQEPVNATFPIVGIGASAGGLKALENFFQHLPEESGMAFVIVQHLAPDYKSELVMLLQRHTTMDVVQITEELPVQPNAVYVIPPNKVLTIEDGTLHLAQRQRQTRQHGPIDVFFFALAADQAERAVAIVLSGTGSDGALGIKAVKEQGGVTLAQEPEDAEYDGMPRSAIATNCVDLVGTAKELAARLVGYRENAMRINLPSTDTSLTDDDATMLKSILSLLRESVGHDFAHYKDSTILRRIARRMRINDIENMADYLRHLRKNEREHKALFQDFLISVTNFFRDGEVFQAVQEEVVPTLIGKNRQNEQLRIWVPGCATGEEAYSLAILFAEIANTQHRELAIQIFATDIDQDALAVAQRGFYSDAITAEVSSDRLLRNFDRVAGGYQIKKNIREKILFANHNLISDPPFSRLDLISCRNLLIYLDRELQETILGLFHYALRPHGYLLLGTSESTDVATGLFQAKNKKQRIFQRLEAAPAPVHLLAQPRHRGRIPGESVLTKSEQPADRLSQYDQWRLQHHTPPALLVDSHYNIHHLFGDAGRYIEMKAGPASLHILDAILPPLRLDLRTALYDVFQNQIQTTTRMHEVVVDNERIYLRLRVGPVVREHFPEELIEVIFEEFPEALFAHYQIESQDETEQNLLAERLEEELIRTKERLQTTVEEYESSNEELQASNEELQSMNEELQSTTEQLETSKEELQSVNEELIIVNQELKEKIDELNRANSDLQNLMASTEIATLFIDRNLQVQRYTPRATDIFHIMQMDIGRPFMHISHILNKDLYTDVEEVLETLIPKEFEVAANDGDWYIVYILPYRTLEDKIDGVVISLIEISKLKRAQEALARREAQQATVAKLGRLALEGATIDVMLRTALKELSQQLNIEYGEVWSLADDGSHLTCVARTINPTSATKEQGAPKQESAKQIPNEPESQAYFVLSSPAPTQLTNLQQEERFTPAPHLVAREIHSGINLPIPGVSTPFGLIGLYSTAPREFNQDELDLLLTTVHLLAEAVERKQAEEELKRLKAELEERVVARTKELERSNQELDRFAYVASHDLNAPLRAIRNLATWAVEDAGERLPKASQEHLDKLLSRIGRMQRLLEDLLVYSRANRFQHNPEWLDSAAIVQDALNLLEIPAGFSIKVGQEMPLFRAERTPLELTLRNLIGNAIKHHDRSNGTISIEAQERDTAVEFIITDDGPGIAKEYQERIFAMFQTLRPLDEIEGSGLGLAIVKKTIESRGGIINVESDPGKGAIFRFTWPKQEKGDTG